MSGRREPNNDPSADARRLLELGRGSPRSSHERLIQRLAATDGPEWLVTCLDECLAAAAPDVHNRQIPLDPCRALYVLLRSDRSREPAEITEIRELVVALIPIDREDLKERLIAKEPS